MNAAQTLLPLVGFQNHAREVIVLNPQHVASVEARHEPGPKTCRILLVTGDSYVVQGDLLSVRQSLQGVPWWAFTKLAEFIEELDEHLVDRENADEGRANPEMRLRTRLMTVKGALKELGFIK